MKKKGTAVWLKRLETENSIALAETLNNLMDLINSEEASAAELTKVVLKDPSLTTQVIRVSNTVHFNPTNEAVTTVSRAILNIGFDAVRTICVSVKIIENILKEGQGTLLLDVLAASVHSAIQARNLIRQISNETKEEVFVAALLLHLAELMVLSSGEPEVDELEKAIKWDDSRIEKDRVAENVLGVSFKRLAQALSKLWNMGGVLQEAMRPSTQRGVKAQAVIYGDEISRIIHKGWDNSEVKALLIEIAAFANKPVSVIKQQIVESAKEADEVADRYGNNELRGLIPVKEIKNSSETNPHIRKPDIALQQMILKELIKLMSAKDTGMNGYFIKILEGLYQGVGIERVAIAFFDQDKTHLRARYAMGEGTEDWKDIFEFKYETSKTNMIFQIFSKGLPVWVGAPEFDEFNAFITPEYRKITGVRDFIIAPLKIKTKQIGFVYGDLGNSRIAITKAHFDGFRKFSQQVNMFLMVVGNRNKSENKN